MLYEKIFAYIYIYMFAKDHIERCRRGGKEHTVLEELRSGSGFIKLTILLKESRGGYRRTTRS